MNTYWCSNRSGSIFLRRSERVLQWEFPALIRRLSLQIVISFLSSLLLFWCVFVSVCKQSSINKKDQTISPSNTHLYAPLSSLAIPFISIHSPIFFNIFSTKIPQFSFRKNVKMPTKSPPKHPVNQFMHISSQKRIEIRHILPILNLLLIVEVVDHQADNDQR